MTQSTKIIPLLTENISGSTREIKSIVCSFVVYVYCKDVEV